jgi:ATP-dependent Lon protease
MSKALEKMSGIDRLPIFPLPLVLLPNELLPLHIFEDRYRKMLADVSDNGNMFGITLFEPSEAFIDRPQTGSTGCVAEIRDVQTTPDERSNIVTLGTVRYRLLDFAPSEEPYLLGEIEFFEDDDEDPLVLNPLADEVFAIFERIAKAAFKMSGNRGRFPELIRTDPESLSFLTAAAFSFENALKYRLIEMTSTIERLERLREILTKAVGQMESSADIHGAAQTNGHSKKKIEI